MQLTFYRIALRTPARSLHFGANSGVVEIAAIGNDRDIKQLPNRLAQAVTCACAARLDVTMLANSAWQIFSELIDNIAEHSSSVLDGYAALQVYRGGNALQVAVSDSGVGIMETLRPGLRRQSPRYAKMSDVELLVEVFRQGISRHSPDTGRGCGLKSCAERAIKFRAELDVRTRSPKGPIVTWRRRLSSQSGLLFRGSVAAEGYAHLVCV